MASAWSATAANAFLNAVLNQTNYTAPTNIYLALYSDSSQTTELSGNNYSRVEVTSSFPAAGSSACSNNVAIDFPVASGAWSAAQSFAIHSHASNDAKLIGGTCSLGALSAGQFHRIASGDLDLTS